MAKKKTKKIVRRRSGSNGGSSSDIMTPVIGAGLVIAGLIFAPKLLPTATPVLVTGVMAGAGALGMNLLKSPQQKKIAGAVFACALPLAAMNLVPSLVPSYSGAIKGLGDPYDDVFMGNSEEMLGADEYINEEDDSL